MQSPNAFLQPPHGPPETCTYNGNKLNLSLAHMHGFPHTHIARWHVPHGFDAAAHLLAMRLRRCSTLFARRPHNLPRSAMHHGPEFEFRSCTHETRASHTCNQEQACTYPKESHLFPFLPRPCVLSTFLLACRKYRL